MTDAQFTFYQMLLETESAINRVAEAEAAAARQRVEMARETGTENARMGGPSSFDKADPTAALEANVRAAQARQSAAAAIAAAEQENDLARARLTYGEQSYELRALEANQAREATEAEIRRLGIAMQGVEASRMRAATEDAIALAEQSRQAASSAAAAKMRGDLEAEARIVQLTAQYGAQSLEVAYARAAAEREVYAATLAAQDISGAAADELMRAWDAARGIAAVNMAAGIGAAASEAMFLAAQLGISLDHAVALEGLKKGGGRGATPRSQPFSFGGTGGLGDGFTGGNGLGFGDLNRPVSYDPPSTGSSGANGKGAGGGAAKSVQDLIAAQERELAVLRETNPVKKELLQYSEELARATPEQRAQLEGMIATRMAEKDALEAVQAAQQELRSTAKSSFLDLVKGATSFKDALSNVLAKMAEMAASSLFDSLWSPTSSGGGGGGAGGIVSSLLGILGFADGGLIGGAGGPREDNHLARVSAGEFIVNAASTAANLPLLRALNAGQPIDALLGWLNGGELQAYAAGGMVGASSIGASLPAIQSRRPDLAASSGASGGQEGKLEQHIHIYGATGNTEIQEMVAQGVATGLEMHDREVLPYRVKDIITNDRVVGR